ncbi:hypothetical protein CERZMDRAFT_103236 [Cercospora zeae-maydis SCOH1-5]|uniref:Uncharacterized protein n=1 Tax=Cercospora zeae-maydis SCOH1-5 TaxID=717836 RepID=A0A6A6EZZ1_9PEZI|nr:hypothetical protein CERZMDRAFT_103236 [Cercospora zeae-maydis SCOH1-5]
MAPHSRSMTLHQSDNLGDPISSKAQQRRLKSRAKQQRVKQQQQQQQPQLLPTKSNITSPKKTTRRRPKVPIGIVPILSGKQKLLQHRANVFKGKERGSGGASVKKDDKKKNRKRKMGRRPLVVG